MWAPLRSRGVDHLKVEADEPAEGPCQRQLRDGVLEQRADGRFGLARRDKELDLYARQGSVALFADDFEVGERVAQLAGDDRLEVFEIETAAPRELAQPGDELGAERAERVF